MDQKHSTPLPFPKPVAALTVSTLSGSDAIGTVDADIGAAARFQFPDLVVLWRASPSAPVVALVHCCRQLRSVSLITGAARTATTFDDDLASLYVCPTDNSLWATTSTQIFRLNPLPVPSSSAATSATATIARVEDGHREFSAELLAGSVEVFVGGRIGPCKFSRPCIIAITDTPAAVATGGKGSEREIVIADYASHRVRVLSMANKTVRTIAGTFDQGKSVAGPALSSPLSYPRGVLDPFHSGEGPADVLLWLGGQTKTVWRLNRRTSMLSRADLEVAEYVWDVVATPCGWLLMVTDKWLAAVDPRDWRVVRIIGGEAVDFKQRARVADGEPLAIARFIKLKGIALNADSTPPRAVVTDWSLIRTVELPPALFGPLGSVSALTQTTDGLVASIVTPIAPVQKHGLPSECAALNFKMAQSENANEHCAADTAKIPLSALVSELSAKVVATSAPVAVDADSLTQRKNTHSIERDATASQLGSETTASKTTAVATSDVIRALIEHAEAAERNLVAERERSAEALAQLRAALAQAKADTKAQGAQVNAQVHASASVAITPITPAAVTASPVSAMAGAVVSGATAGSAKAP